MDIGGAERIVYQLATDLKDEFDHVHVASTGGLWEEKLAENGIQHHRILDVDSKQPATVLQDHQREGNHSCSHPSPDGCFLYSFVTDAPSKIDPCLHSP